MVSLASTPSGVHMHSCSIYSHRLVGSRFDSLRETRSSLLDDDRRIEQLRLKPRRNDPDANMIHDVMTTLRRAKAFTRRINIVVVCFITA
jgi:hypothetical protein